MLNLLLNELFVDLAHTVVLWLKFYQALSTIVDKLKTNLDSLDTFISEKLISANYHMTHNYNYMVDLETLADLIEGMEKNIFCFMVYDSQVYKYIKAVTFNVHSVPRYFSGIVQVKFPTHYNGEKLKASLTICKLIKKNILSVKDCKKEENKKIE